MLKKADLAALALALCPVLANAETLEFNRDIRPILSDKCFLCHGFDKNARKANLRLDDRVDALAQREGTAAIVPGDPETSELVKRILSTDPGHQMPPPESERSLTEAEKATLVEWVRQGAEYEEHWAYIPPKRHDLPETKANQWLRNPVDFFVLHGLEQKGIAPSEEADRVTLIRRLSLDLLGIPPSPEEVAQFVNDSSPSAYDNLVERLLASPHFGERMAVDWLDVVRYADTNGYHGDEHRSVWPYRDYVINAFNSNKPYDEFTREQIAGDLLPNATREQKVAAAFNRLNQLTAEGGAQAKEYLAKYAADRVRTVSTAWLGSTMGCAECHDHKFDPFTSADFYAMEAVFSDIQERGVYNAGQPWDPLLELPTPEQEVRAGQLKEEMAALQGQLDTQTEALAATQALWEKQVQDELAGVDTGGWTSIAPAKYSGQYGTILTLLEGDRLLASGPDPDREVYHFELPAQPNPVTALRLSALLHEAIPNGLARLNGNFVLTTASVEQAGKEVKIASAVADFEQPDFPASAAIDDGKRTGWAVQGHELKGEERELVLAFEQPAAPNVPLQVELRFESNHVQHTAACLRLSLTGVEKPQLPAKDRLPAEVIAALSLAPEARDAAQQDAVARYYRSIAPELDPVRAQLAQKREQEKILRTEMPFVLATVSVKPRDIRLLPRGNWLDESGPVMQPAMPGFLRAAEPTDKPMTRVDFAEWLVSPDNPLTARVFVNRLWAQYFGTGLSKVLDDLGSQGEWPTHPELLDWLAVEFRESGWDIKHMVRLIVTSATYRQSSLPREELKDLDPFNRLLARQSRFRLKAEFVRDNALAVSGLLSSKVGGRSVFPYQPDGYWDNCNTFTGPLIYNTDQGEDQYRRGMYTYWKRSFLHPSMQAFDAPTREECTADRTSSNTPLQALVLLNDPTFVEAARVLAERIWTEGGQGVSDRIGWAFEQVLSRPPSEREMLVLMNLYVKHRAEYQQEPDAVEGLQSVGFASLGSAMPPEEIGAWTSVARVLLNLHETITRI